MQISQNTSANSQRVFPFVNGKIPKDQIISHPYPPTLRMRPFMLFFRPSTTRTRPAFPSPPWRVALHQNLIREGCLYWPTCCPNNPIIIIPPLIEQQPQITHYELCARGALISNLTINPQTFSSFARKRWWIIIHPRTFVNVRPPWGEKGGQINNRRQSTLKQRLPPLSSCS